MKRIIIIGATSGIGYELVQQYLAAGYRIGIAGRRTGTLAKMKESHPEQIEYEQIDVTSTEAGQQLLSLIKKTGGMDIYLHCSGTGSQNKQLDINIELETLRTNVEGFTRMVDTAFHYFKEKKSGHIAVISSIAGTKGIGVAPSYSATKRFQNTYIDALAQLCRLEKLNIHFTDIRPGFVATPLLKDDKYPMMMETKPVARQIIRAIEKRKRRKIIDWRYRILVFFWQALPEWLWERLPILP